MRLVVRGGGQRLIIAENSSLNVFFMSFIELGYSKIIFQSCQYFSILGISTCIKISQSLPILGET